jgi:thiol-disulfide isomerase/thioredoxin
MPKKLMVILAMMIALLLIITACQPSELPNGTSPTTTSPTTTVEGSQAGNLAPDFALQDLEGQTVTLSDLRGSPVMLNFWATWCGPCRHEMPFIQQIYEEWLDKGLVLLTINLRETPAKVEEFMQSNGLSFPALLDRDGSVSLEYNVSGIPTTFFIDKDGIIQEKRIGSFSSAAEIEDYLNEIMP